MASLSHGMDIARIEALGAKLQNDFAHRIAEVASQLEKLVGDTAAEWSGPDAETFRSWWPGKRSKLAAIVEDLPSAVQRRVEAGVAGSGRNLVRPLRHGL